MWQQLSLALTADLWFGNLCLYSQGSYRVIQTLIASRTMSRYRNRQRKVGADWSRRFAAMRATILMYNPPQASAFEAASQPRR